MILVGPNIGSINLAKVVFAIFLHCKGITCSFVIYKLSVGRQFESTLYLTHEF